MSPLSKRWTKLSVLLLTAWLVAGTGSASPRNYTAVIDAGSSGSRVHLYERTVVGVNAEVRSIFSKQGGRPMSSFAASPNDAGPIGVKPLLDELSAALAGINVLPHQVHVHLLATAGMRLIEERNPASANAIYASVRATLTASGMAVGRVETLAGVDEGVYAWVDLNDLRGNFREPGRSLEGVIEVGGASAQVTYASTNAPGDHSASVTVNNTTYRLFSISWLGLGQDEARAAMFKRIHEGGGETNNVCYPNNPAAAGNLTGFNVDIQGYRVNSAQFDLAQCESLYSAVLQPFNVRSASANSDFASVRFVGVSSVYYAFSDWGGLTDAASIRENLRAVCTGVNAWESVAARLGGTNKFKQNACANGTFINSLLFGSNGLGVEPTIVTAVDKVAGRTPSWTRGFALVGK